MGNTSRTKGLQFEQKIARFFQDLGYEDARRNLREDRDSDGYDLMGVDRFLVQCKRYKKKGGVINTWLDEVPDSDTAYKLLVAKTDYNEPYVAMKLDDFKELMEAMKAEGIL